MLTRLLAFVSIATLAVAVPASPQAAPGTASGATRQTAAPPAGAPQTGAQAGAPQTAAPQTGAPQSGAPQQGVPQAGAAGTGGAQAGAPAASPSVQRPALDLPADYRLTIGDKLRVEVYKDPQLSQSLQVRPDGKVTLPLVGDITAAGLTSIELREQIASALKEYVTNPVVTVIVVETVPPVVYVMGEVTNPGAVPMHGPMSVLQALAMAGGFRDFANTKNIRVLRRNARGVQTIGFNYKDAVKGDGNPLTLQPGDTVIVP